jgi:hypothetical protein
MPGKRIAPIAQEGDAGGSSMQGNSECAVGHGASYAGSRGLTYTEEQCDEASPREKARTQNVATMAAIMAGMLRR